MAAAFAADMGVAPSAADATVTGAAIGTVRIVETPYGLVFYPQLKGLAPSMHGFHVHETASCSRPTARPRSRCSARGGSWPT